MNEFDESAVSGGLMHQRDDQLRRDLSELLALLVFDELAAVQEWYDCTVPYFHRLTPCLENLKKSEN